MKLLIQIPCFNEADVLPLTVQALPRQLPGIDTIEFLVIDDGSTDATVQVAQSCGVHHIIEMKQHTGLAASFANGLDACLGLGADIIVNTDADNQYAADDIQALVSPIISASADIVVGDRGIASHPEFSMVKRALQRLGSWVVGQTSGLHIPDATSGFRAYSRQAALRTIVLSRYSYTLETLIQAGAHQMKVIYVPVRTNPPTRPSRLMRNMPHYMLNSSQTIVRSYAMYRPLRVFTWIGGILIAGAIFLFLRYFYFYLSGSGAGHIQSVIMGAVLAIVGFQTFLIGLLADLIGFNRTLLEDILFRVRRLEHDPAIKPTDTQSQSRTHAED